MRIPILMPVLISIILNTGCEKGISEKDVERLYACAVNNWLFDFRVAKDRTKANFRDYLDSEARKSGASDWSDFTEKAKESIGEDELGDLLIRLNQKSFDEMRPIQHENSSKK